MLRSLDGDPRRDIAPGDWQQIGLVVPQFRDWCHEPQQLQRLDPIQLASKLDALAVRYVAESAEAKKLAASCKQYASRLRAGAE